MANTKIVFWNSAGLRASAQRTAEKLAFIDKEFPHGKFDKAAFVETHHKNEEDLPDEIREYATHHHLIHTPTPETHTHSGIVVLISKEFEISRKSIILPGRLLNMRIAHTTTKAEYNLSVFYGPQWSKMKKTEITKFIEIFNNTHTINENNIFLPAML